MKRQINKLTHEKHFLLVEMIRAEREWLTTAKPKMTDAAGMLSTKLGFPVSDETVARACQLAGVVWERPVNPKTAERGKTVKRVGELETMVLKLLDDNQRLHGRLDVLAGLLHRVIDLNNLRCPPGSRPTDAAKLAVVQ